MLVSTKLVYLSTVVFLLALAPGCSPNEPPQAASAPLAKSTENEAKPSTVTYQTPSPPSSLVERLVKTKECPKCDLSGADLKKVDLQGAELDSIDLEGASL